MALFKRVPGFVMHSGQVSDWKLECDDLTDEDIDTIAYLMSRKLTFFGVYGIPEGGNRIAKALKPYIVARETPKAKFLVVDDVYTTGQSMERARQLVADRGLAPYIMVRGQVIWNRSQEGPMPSWISPLNTVNERW
jgi:hypothetical protein